MIEQSSRSLLSEDGPLAQNIDGFKPRQAQIDLACAVEDTFDSHHVLIAEAGTGTGKTYAYLIPALMSGEKVIISTGTKNLQDQLFLRDLPIIRKALAVKVRVALLKGRSNYLCLHRLNMNAIDSHYVSDQMLDDLQRIQIWANKTRQGDIAELDDIQEDSAVFPFVTSSSDNCLGSECNFYDECYLMKARKSAQEADVVVINHHLFFADCAIRESGFGELLPAYNSIVFDEAHLLPEIAGQYFGKHVSSRQILDLCADITAAAKDIGNDMPDVLSTINEIKLKLQDVRLQFNREPQRGDWLSITKNTLLQRSIEKVHIVLEELNQELEVYSERSLALENCYERLQTLHTALKLLTQPSPPEQIHWYEIHKKSFTLHHTPMNIADIFRELVYKAQRSWVFTSATMTVENKFDHFQRTMGLNKAKTLQLDSPFDYQKQALLYCPRDMPEPKNPDYVARLLTKSLPLIKACGGKTFILFTSHRALQLAGDILKDNLDYLLLVQGSRSKTQLLAEFSAADNAVLLGTYSFWEGVDVRGEQLSCVIIDKLPFESPGDPILKARMQAMKQQGADPFMQHQLPLSVIMLRQGIGRLIRDTDDKGIIMIADPRLTTRRYGQAYITSFPSMPMTREENKVLAFIDTLPFMQEQSDKLEEA